GEIRLVVVEHRVGAQVPAATMVAGSGGRDHLQPRLLCELHGAGSDAPRTAAHESGLPGADTGPVVQAEERGRRGMQGRHGGERVGAYRQPVEPVGRYDGALGAAPLPPAVPETVAPYPLARREPAAQTCLGHGTDGGWPC